MQEAALAQALAQMQGCQRRLRCVARNYPDCFPYGDHPLGAVVVALNALWQTDELAYGSRTTPDG